MKIYFDSRIKSYTLELEDSSFAGVDGYAVVFNSGSENIYSATFKLTCGYNKVITFTYLKESLSRLTYDEQLEAFLAANGLRLSDINPNPIAISIPPSEYEAVEKDLSKIVARRYPSVEIEGKEGKYFYDKVIVHSSTVYVHIIELNDWVSAILITTKEFQEELEKAIEYFWEHAGCRYYGRFIRDF